MPTFAYRRPIQGNVMFAALGRSHFTQAGEIETAIEWWGKAGQRSVERSALVEAAEQFTRALSQIATLPATPALRREEIKLQVALITPLSHLNPHPPDDAWICATPTAIQI